MMEPTWIQTKLWKHSKMMVEYVGRQWIIESEIYCRGPYAQYTLAIG